VIRFEALRKDYGPLVAVDDLTLDIEAGSVFGFIGRNGAGKTTTIRMMTGLLAPSAGTVVLAGHDVRRAPEAAKAVTGYLPDHPFLYDKLTGVEFLDFVAGLYGLARRERAARAAALLEDFGLAARAGELVETFSHGMKQRLALAAALIHRPRILVLDEPMVGLDPEGALALRRLLVRLAATGVTIFLSTHSLAVAEELCGRIGILDRGRLVALGTLAELRARAVSPGRLPGGDDDAVSLERVFLDILGPRDGADARG
jgi:ABC-2 type transport system ATP-binding protein